MRVLTASTFVALAAALALGGSVASAATAGDQSRFDLGIDVSSVPADRPDVSAFMGSLPVESQSVLQTSCAHYVADPGDAESPATVPFCRQVLASADSTSGLGVRTFGAVSPPAIIAPAIGQGGGAAAGHRYNVFPDENAPDYGTDANPF